MRNFNEEEWLREELLEHFTQSGNVLDPWICEREGYKDKEEEEKMGVLGQIPHLDLDEEDDELPF